MVFQFSMQEIYFFEFYFLHDLRVTSGEASPRTDKVRPGIGEAIDFRETLTAKPGGQ